MVACMQLFTNLFVFKFSSLHRNDSCSAHHFTYFTYVRSFFTSVFNIISNYVKVEDLKATNSWSVQTEQSLMISIEVLLTLGITM